MMPTLVLLVIGLPWLGALLVWATGDARPKLQHGLAVGFSLAAGAAALAMLFFSGQTWSFGLAAGPSFGSFSFAPDGLGIFLGIVANV